MKKLVLLLLVCFSTIHNYALEVESEIDKVTVFRNQAYVERTASHYFEKGEHQVVFSVATNDFSKQDARVKISSLNTKLLDFKIEKNDVNFQNEEKKRLQDKLPGLLDRQDNLIAKKERINQKREFLSSSLIISSRSNSKNIDPDRMIKTLDFYNANAEAVDLARTETNNLIKEVEKEIKNIRQQIKDLEKNFKNENSINLFKITFLNEVSQNVDFRITYTVRSCSWNPTYDLYASEDYSKINMVVYAEVKQNSGEDWNSVNLNISTSYQKRNENIPQLTTWFVDRRRSYDRNNKMKFRGGRSNEVSYTIDGMSVSDPVDGGAALTVDMDKIHKSDFYEQNLTNLHKGMGKSTFELNNRVSIQSDNEYHKKMIMSKNFEVENEFYCVPRLSEQVFIKSSLTNNTENAFLAGKANIYHDNTLISKINFPNLMPTQNIKFSLGSTENTIAKFKLADSKKEQLTFSGDIRYTLKYEIETENFFINAIDLIIEDSYPKAKSSKIKIEQLEIENDEFAENREIDEEKGRIKWKINIDSGTKKKIKFGYEIVAPKSFKFINK